nr:BMP family ABC transporter substrate-binding protein [uncultured Oscillibacter sp.]
MSRQEAAAQYAAALKQGRKTYHDCVLRGRYPYPQVLDEIISETMVAGQVDLGVVEIPIDQIKGTKSAGRRTAFAADFMPLLDVDSEFGAKWMELCTAHLGDEGIREPIRCYEYLGRFYVQEGNKRVSVLKSYGAPVIPGYVTRMVPVWSEDPEIQAYYDFMDSYPLTRLYRVRFSRSGSFQKLQKALGYEVDHVWTDDERRRFTAGYTYFQEPFRKLGGGELNITTADAMLVWLKVYEFDQLMSLPAGELSKSIKAVWADIQALTEPIEVKADAPEPRDSGLLGRLFKPARLNAAFVSDQLPEHSDWARAHDLGRQYLEAVLGERVTTQVFYGVRPGGEAERAMETAIENGAQMIFAVTPPLIGACRKTAAQHPDVRILNCSVSMPYAGVQTYYGRIYEGKFIAGAIAGALSRDGRIGYVASSPIFGVPAGINAFARGAQLTNPNVRILLRWSCAEGNPMVTLARQGLSLIANRDIPTPDRIQEPWGLCRAEGGSFRSLASPYWHWGNVYTNLVRGVLSGGLDVLAPRGPQAVNYWWGMNSRAVDILLGEDLPDGVRQLAEILRRGIMDGSIQPFPQAAMEEILHMDQLDSCVEGRIPAYQELLPMARSIVRLQGVYREDIPPEKEDPIL